MSRSRNSYDEEPVACAPITVALGRTIGHRNIYIYTHIYIHICKIYEMNPTP